MGKRPVMQVTLRRERNEGRCRVMISGASCTVRLNIEKAVEIRRLF